MKFGVLALDYDGTIARDGVLDPAVRAAIADVRAHGIVVVIATGRILSELEQVTGGLQFVDAVVAENGAVLAFPNGYSRLIANPVLPEFLQELRRRGLDFKAGQCVVELDADAAPQVLAVIRDLELPLVQLFNRGRLMILPPGINKSIGLREALTILRRSVHNAVAIGDAENDHDLLATCEIGVAAGWGSGALQRVADEILRGTGPADVAPYIRRMAEEIRLPPERIGQHRLLLGTAGDGHVLTLAVRGRNLLVVGDARSGKSWVNGLACEQLILQGYSVCVIDPEGDYRTLETLPGVVVFGGDDPPPELPDLARVLRHPDLSVIVDLSHAAHREKINYVASLLPMLAATRRTTGLPHRIVIDEAHYFLHDPDFGELLDLNLGAYTLVTYRLSDLYPDLRAAIETVIAKRTSEPREVRSLLELPGAKDFSPDWERSLECLQINEAILLPGNEEESGKLLKFDLSPRLTSHVRHKAKYLDVQLLREQGFVFTENGVTVGTPARSLKEFISVLSDVPPAVIEGHARRGDFSRWIANVFRDHAFAAEVRKLEQRFRMGHMLNIADSLGKLVRERYELSEQNLSVFPSLPTAEEFEADRGRHEPQVKR